ncbi:MAG: CCA tRNA nucleotidyltransferase [Paracoccaceae bacterium]
MRITGAWLTSVDTQRVLNMLTDAGHLAYVVGGCVRNALLGVAVADVDIATDALPDVVTKLAKTAGLKAIPTGIAHGTVTVICGDTPFEITSFRKDIATDGRRAVVAFSRDIAQDARRRDFTINALYASAEGVLTDPLGNLADIAGPKIRFIENPTERIREDYLRILRFFRFYAYYGDANTGPDPEGLAACAEGADGLEGLSKERIGAEMRKLLAAPNPAPSLSAMSASGVLARVLPGADAQYIAPLIHLETSGDFAPSWQRRLAALGAKNLAIALRLSGVEAKYLQKLGNAQSTDAPVAQSAYLFGPAATTDAMLIRSATLSTPLPRDFAQNIARGNKAVFPVSAADLLERFGEGPKLGRELARLKDLWLESDFALGRQTLLRR